MDKKNFLVFLLGSLFFISSCGTNVFEGLVDGDEDTSLSSRIEDASSVADYEKILTDSLGIVTSDSMTDSEKGDTYFIMAEAVLGANDQSPLELFADIAESAENEGDNPLSILDIDVDHDELKKAAGYITSAEGKIDANADQELLKGVVNTMIVVNAIKDVYIVDKNGDLTAKDADKSAVDNLSALLRPSGDSSGLKTYSDNAVAGFEASDSLDETQLAKLEKIQTAINDLNTLNNSGSVTDEKIQNIIKSINL
jgi:hypothetical protein